MPPPTHGQWEPPVTFAVASETLRDTRTPPNTITDTRGLFVLHAVLMYTGNVLLFSGHTESVYYATVSYVFAPGSGALRRVPFPPGVDLFCCHYVQIADGRILALGGSDIDFVHHSSVGAKNICLFDPRTETWEKSGEELNEGRWYPTAILLGDGRVVIVSGRRAYGATPATPAHIAEPVEVFDPGAFDWEAEILTGAGQVLPLYPGLHLAPNGRIYYTHTNWGQQIVEPQTMALTVTDDSGSWTSYPGRMPAQPRREEGMSVLLPPAQDGKILLVGGSEARNSADVAILQPGGGGPSSFDHIVAATDPVSAEILDTSVNPPTWSAAPGGPMSHPRINGHCVLLPDRTVLIVGGHDSYKWNSIGSGTTPSLTPELFDPGVGFDDMEPMAHPRMYHSIALLLPDGRVLVAGGADPNASEPTLVYPGTWNGPTYGAGLALNRKDYQIYRPRYFFNGPRPRIKEILRDDTRVTQIHYGDTLVVRTDQAADIAHVALMRPGAPTHHTDSEQRYVALTFTAAGGDRLTVQAPTTTQTSLAPPGYYMLWIEDNQRRPSEVGEWVQLTPRCTLCFVATVTLGSEAAPGVVHLRRVRSELERGTRFGRWFVACVNAAYYSFSPRLAARLAERVRARVAVRDVIVRPAVAGVRAADELTGRVRPKQVRHALLIALLVAEAVVGAALAPLWLAAVAVAALLAGKRALAD